ncbi:MAG: hypothetical protein IKC63_01795 [Clostridia bacterium]|nr:hypothetical protein [Clostridia bacterium]
MKKTSKIICILLTLITLLGIAQFTVSAANACVNVRGSAADCDKWVTIKVNTGKNWGKNTITFTQTKGVMKYYSSSSNKSTYGAYTIKVTNQDTGKTTEYYWKYTKNYTLKLSDNTDYIIKIKPYQPSTVGDQNLKNKSFDTILARLLGGYRKTGWEWQTPATWTIKSTKAVNWCVSK